MSKFIGIFGDTVKYRFLAPENSEGKKKEMKLDEDRIRLLLRKSFEELETISSIGEESNDLNTYLVFEQSHDMLSDIVCDWAKRKGFKTVSLYNKEESKDLKLIQKTDFYRGYTTATKYQTIFNNIDIYLNIGEPKDSFDFADKYNCIKLQANKYL